MEIYHTFYSTSRFVVTVTRDNIIVDICIYDKTGDTFRELICSTYENISEREALRLTRKVANL